jgi:hypothetical protein
MIGNNQVRFGEGPTEKDHPGGTSLAAYSTFGGKNGGKIAGSVGRGTANTVFKRASPTAGARRAALRPRAQVLRGPS